LGKQKKEDNESDSYSAGREARKTNHSRMAVAVVVKGALCKFHQRPCWSWPGKGWSKDLSRTL